MTEIHSEQARVLDPDLVSRWNALARTSSPLADAEWARCFSDAFATPGWSPTIHLVFRGRELVAAVPMARRGGLARAWESLDNEHNPYWLAGGELDDASAEHLLDSLSDGDYLFLRRLHLEGATCKALLAAAERKALHVSLIRSEVGDARIALRGTWEELRAALPKDCKDLPRKQRQLAKQGRLELSTLATVGPDLDATLAECFAVERLGWKGREGTAIVCDPRARRFYTDLAHAMAARHRFQLHVLRLDGDVIAFQYTLCGGGHIELLKESYDPAYAARSPGHVLRMMVLQQLFERGEGGYYHMGRTPLEGHDDAWKLRWATEIAPLCTLRIYGHGLRAHGAYLAGPVLRGALKPLVATARTRLHELRQRFTRPAEAGELAGRHA
jgi:CelD/BcsL family acetyltransferase involved in cellulose biosynthesis